MHFCGISNVIWHRSLEYKLDIFFGNVHKLSIYKPIDFRTISVTLLPVAFEYFLFMRYLYNVCLTSLSDLWIKIIILRYVLVSFSWFVRGLAWQLHVKAVRSSEMYSRVHSAILNLFQSMNSCEIDYAADCLHITD